MKTMNEINDFLLHANYYQPGVMLNDPQTIPGGFLIIKLNDINNKKVSINMKKELNNLIKLKTNQQLNQFSNIYFNKIKKNIKIEKI